jgi:outer membrane protein OmpA-like peptidoglycan-associated protein
VTIDRLSPLRRLMLATLPAVLAAGCASTSGPPTERGVVAPPLPPGSPLPGDPAVPGRPAPPPPAPATPLAAEQRFLEDWFRGTPVVIGTSGASQLTVDVPLAHSFDSGKVDIKPALNAVLERVAQSLLRQPGARLVVAAPGDPGNGALAQARAQRVREHLLLRRVAAPRIELGPAVRPGGAVQLRLSIPPAAFPSAARSAP